MDEYIPRIDAALKECGLIASFGPNKPQKPTKKIVVGVAHYHSRPDQIANDVLKGNWDKFEALFRHQNEIATAFQKIIQVCGKENTHLVFENRPRSVCDWSDNEIGMLNAAADFETNGLPSLQESESRRRQYYSEILDIVRKGANQKDSSTSFEEALEKQYMIDGMYRAMGKMSQDGYRSNLHGHNNIGREHFEKKSPVELQIQQARDDLEKIVLEAEVAAMDVEYMKVSHQGIKDVIQEDIPDDSVVIVGQGASHFASFRQTAEAPQLTRVKLENYLITIPHTVFRILGTKSLMEMAKNVKIR